MERRQLRRPVLGGERIPVEGDGTVRINYAGPTIPAVSFHEVLDKARVGRPWPATRGKLVLVGVPAPGEQGARRPAGRTALPQQPDGRAKRRPQSVTRSTVSKMCQ